MGDAVTDFPSPQADYLIMTDETTMNGLKLCMLLESYYPVVGGMETQARNMSGSFRDSGIRVVILTRRIHEGLAAFETLDDIPVHRVGPGGQSSRLRWYLVLSSIPALIRLRIEYDIILVPGFRALGISAVIAARLLGKKCVLKAESSGEMSGDFFTGGLSRMKLKKSSFSVRIFIGFRNWILRRADVFASLSREQTREFTSCGVSENQIVVIPQSVRTDVCFPLAPDQKIELRRRLGLPEQELIIIYTGRLVSYKGLPLLLEAWPEILKKYPGAHLIACGAGGVDVYNCEDEVKKFVLDRHLSESVLLTGAISNVDEYLKAADIYALPTQNEAFPLALLEAMACGLPSVSTPVGGIPDIIRHEVNGLMVPPGNEPELRQALLRLMADPGLRKQLGDAALKTARDNYARETVTTAYIELFSRLMKS